MVQIEGQYKLVDSKNLYEFLVGVGYPEDKAKTFSEVKGTLDVKIDGKKLTLASDKPPNATTLVFDEEVEERLPGNTVVKSTAKKEGNVITIKTNDGGSRILTFTDSGLEYIINAPKGGKIYSATRIYNRV